MASDFLLEKTESWTGATMKNVNSEVLPASIVINKVLCYTSTARHTMKNDDIVRICLAFYSDEEIIGGKDMLYELAGEKPKRRRHENRRINEIQDLLDMLRKCESSGISLPTYVADSYDCLPPSSGFEVVAQSIVSLMDETTSLRKEVEALREQRFNETVHQQDIKMIKEDVVTMKGELRKINHRILGEAARRNSLVLESFGGSQLTSTDKRSNRKCKSNDALEACESMHEYTSLDIRECCNVSMGSPSAPPASQEPWGFLARPFQDAGGNPSAPPPPSFASMVKGPETGLEGESVSPSAPPLSQQVIPSGQMMELSLGAVPKKKALMTSGKSSVFLDEDGYQLVQKTNRKRNDIIGRKKETNGETLRSAKKNVDIYVGNCDLNVTIESLSEYILNEMNIKIDNCEMLISRNTRSRSFKVTLNLKDRDKLLSPEVWPEDIICRKFFNPRKPKV